LKPGNERRGRDSAALSFFVCITLATLSTARESKPVVLTPDVHEKAAAPVPLEYIEPAPDNPGHFIARQRDLLSIARKYPDVTTSPYDEAFGIKGIPRAVTAEAFRILEEEGGSFDRALRDQALTCSSSVAPASAQVIVVDVVSRSSVQIPVFLSPEADPLSYFELAVDNPGAPVFIVVRSNLAIALRVTLSDRTKFAGLRLTTIHSGIVLGLDPRLVERRTYLNQSDKRCPRLDSMDPNVFEPRSPAPDEADATHYTFKGGYQFAIGNTVPVVRGKPTIGNFLDPDMPLPGHYALLVLSKSGYIRPLAAPEITKQSLRYEAYEVQKPFRFPAGLNGGNAVTFILPPGVESPSGRLLHSTMVRSVK
jgi:hypothetical protein